jgi:fibronectin-binding autotransporter adhesin
MRNPVPFSPFRSLHPVVAVTLLTISLTWLANGADRRWTGDAFNNTWSEEDNWSPSGPPQDGDTLIFGNLASQKSNRNDLSNLRVQSIVFNGSSGGYTLNGNPILLNSDITAAHTSGNNSVRLGVQFTHGGGTFNVVNGGRMEISGTVTLANNASLIAFTLGTNLTISGAIVGDGDLTKLGAHSLFLTGTAANTYTGPTFINGGTVYLDKSSGARAISPRVSIGDQTLLNCQLADMDGGQYPPAMSVVIGDRGTWGLTNGATVTNLTIINGYIRGEGLLNLLCNVTNYGYSEIDCSLYLGDQTRTFFVESDGGFARQLEIAGHVLGPSGGASPPGIVKEGSGLLILKNQNTYSGPMLVNDGVVSAEHPQALGTATGETRVKRFAALDVGRYFPTNPIAFSEPIVLEGGHLGGFSDVVLNGPLTLNADSSISGPDNGRLNITTSISGPGGLKVVGGHVRFSGPVANTFAGAVVVEPAFLRDEAILELAKPNDVAAVPTPVTLQGFRTNIAILRNFQHNGARDITILDGGVWHLNGFAATPTSLKFLGGGVVDTGLQGTFPGILNFTGAGVNTQLQVLPKQPTPSNYTARILGRVDFFSSTNDVFIPPGITLDWRAEIRGITLQKRGPGKLILGGDNRFLANIFAHDGEVVSTGSRALGVQCAVSDGATLWLASVFNFGSLTLQGRGFQDRGALATDSLAIFSSNIVLAASTTIHSATANGNLHLQAGISGVGPLTKEGAGMLTFEGATANTFTGDTLVNVGMLVLAKNSFVPSVPGDVIIGSGGITKGGPGSMLIAGLHANTYAGPTLVNDGALEVWRVRSPGLPGDVVVTGSNTTLRTGRDFAPTALASNVSVTLKNGALWTMSPLTTETIRELRGDGRLTIGGNATLTIDAEDSHEFSGVLSGTGALEKRGSGQLLLSGISPGYTGTSTVFFGSLKVDGRIPNSPMTVKSSAELRGDGSVGHATAIEQDSVVRVDSSFADHPDRQAGDLAVGDLTI